MASPRTHAKWTIVLIAIYFIFHLILYLLSYPREWDWKVTAAVLFFGIFIDIDHVIVTKQYKIVFERPGHVDWFHTLDGAEIALLLSLKFWSWWPLVSFTVHMILLDSRNRALRIKPGKDPLPEACHRLWPEWLTYDYEK